MEFEALRAKCGDSSTSLGMTLQRPRLLDEAEVSGGEAADVGEDGGELRGGDAEPLRERGGVLNRAEGGNPAAVGAGVIRAAEGERGEGSIHLAAFDGTANDDVVGAPCVIATRIGVGLIGTAEVGHGECGDIGGDAKLLRGLIEGGEGGTYLREKPVLESELVGVGVEVADAG